MRLIWIIVIVLFLFFGCRTEEVDKKVSDYKESAGQKSTGISLQPQSTDFSVSTSADVQTNQKARDGWKVFMDSSNSYSIHIPEFFIISEKEVDEKDLLSRVVFKRTQDSENGRIILEVYSGTLSPIEKKLTDSFEFISKRQFVLNDLAIVKYVGVSNTDFLFISPITSDLIFSARVQGVDMSKIFEDMLRTLIFLK